jgi:hypothetical protein
MVLPAAAPNQFGALPRTLVVDLDGTLVHKSWTRKVRSARMCLLFVCDVFVTVLQP